MSSILYTHLACRLSLTTNWKDTSQPPKLVYKQTTKQTPESWCVTQSQIICFSHTKTALLTRIKIHAHIVLLTQMEKGRCGEGDQQTQLGQEQLLIDRISDVKPTIATPGIRSPGNNSRHCSYEASILTAELYHQPLKIHLFLCMRRRLFQDPWDINRQISLRHLHKTGWRSHTSSGSFPLVCFKLRGYIESFCSNSYSWWFRETNTLVHVGCWCPFFPGYFLSFFFFSFFFCFGFLRQGFFV